MFLKNIHEKVEAWAVSIYMFKVNNGNTKRMCGIC